MEQLVTSFEEAERGRQGARLSGAQRREVLLRAAAGLFAERGYHGASIAEIARRAGITKPVIYHHFASKRALHRAVFAHYAELLLATAAERGQPESIHDALHDVVLGMFEFAQQSPEAWQLLLGDSNDPETARLQQQLRKAGTRFAAARLLAEPGFRPPVGLSRETAAAVLAQLTRSAVDGLVDWSLKHPTVSHETLVRVATDLLWKGLEDSVGPTTVD